MGKAEIRTNLNDPVIYTESELCRHKQLPAELSHEAHPHGPADAVVEVDFLGGEVGERLVAQIRQRDLIQQIP